MLLYRRFFLLAAAAAPLGTSVVLAERRTKAADAPEVVEWHSLTRCAASPAVEGGEG